MPFQRGNQLGKLNLGRRKNRAKTLWLLEELDTKGFNFSTKLVTLLEKAIKGDKVALEAAHLLVKLLPHVSNAPKADAGAALQIDTLVINRHASGAPVFTDADIEASIESPVDTPETPS